MTGLKAAHDEAYTHALQIDADGQHAVEDIPGFLALAAEHPGSMICGEPVFGEDMPRLRFYARYLTLFLSWLESLSLEIRDAMCGFRLYPVDKLVRIIGRARLGKRMAFDPEILVRAVWSGIPLRYTPVHVRYPEGGRSHFRLLRDNLEISWMHTRMIAGMLLRSPVLVWRKCFRSGSGTSQ